MQSPFEVFGLPVRYAIDVDALEDRYRELHKALHPDRHVAASPSDRRAALSRAVTVNEAYRTLRNELSRAEAVLATLDAPKEADRDQAFLTKMMELREDLLAARGDATALAKLRDRVMADNDASRSELAHALDVARDAKKATDALARMRYFRRFLDEAMAYEEDLRA